VREAHAAYRLGPAAAHESYLSVHRVLAACRSTGAQAVHPGYGFLSENAAFAEALEDAGIAFIGPPVRAIQVMGDKITAKNTVMSSGVPVVPGIARPGLTDADLTAAAPEIGFPVLIKPSAGGGGKGMRVVEGPGELAAALSSARREARSSFGDDTLFLERFVQRPRHIEVQILADRHGSVVHLGERECSLQRRHQKVVEEAPSVLLDVATRARIGEAACATARSVDYTGAGTVEFIVSADRPDEFFFMEMNTRLQVEHPVTEMVTGLDLVEWQVRVAAGEALPFTQGDIRLNGHAVEARVYAEDPARGFLPTGGEVLHLVEPIGQGVRVDSGLQRGSVVSSHYDPMLGKVIAHGADREAALAELDRALADTVLLGVQTNLGFLRTLLQDPDVQAGDLDTTLLDRIAESLDQPVTARSAVVGAAAHLWLQRWAAADPADPWAEPSGWRMGEPAPFECRLSVDGRTVIVRVRGTPDHAFVTVDDEEAVRVSCRFSDDVLSLTIDDLETKCRVADDGAALWVHVDGATSVLRRVPRQRLRTDESAAGSSEVTSPMPGAVIAVHVTNGQAVEAGDPVIVVEAMKMEHTLRAPNAGTVELLAAPGAQVAMDQALARVTPAADGYPEITTEGTP
jgi:acetyl-CoA/propionyl-CoA carboxylase, biotin carboxylase, biotin carboxyl carrier protein